MNCIKIYTLGIGLTLLSCSTFRPPCTSIEDNLKKIDFKGRSEVTLKGKVCANTVPLIDNSRSSFLQGQILDRRSGNGVLAVLFVKELEVGIETNSDGIFHLDIDRRDDLTVQVSAVGYDDFLIKNMDFTDQGQEVVVLLGTTIIK